MHRQGCAQIFEQVIGSTTFLYSRSTVESSLPLMSILSISPVSKNLNGTVTVVNCTDVTTLDRVSTVMNVIIILVKLIIMVVAFSLAILILYIIPNKESNPQKINVASQLVLLESDGVIITLHVWWTGDGLSLTFH